ncbi:MAG: trigger factor [Gammaproteobacteria bacterium]|nr:MAG: trigger factor [Gammaproteobacteria bacterium]
MQVSVETTTGLERKMTVGIPSSSIDSEVNKKLQELSRTQKMAGFRPGKIPMSVIRKRFGGHVQQDVMREAMQRSYFDAVNQEKLQPAGQPLIEPGAIEKGKDFEFVATFEVFPEISINSFADLKIEKPVAEILDKDLDTMLSTLQKQRGTWEPIKRMAKKEDMVIIDFDGTVDGESFEGGSAEDFSLILGSDSMIPGFEKQLLKVKKDAEVDVNVTFPEDYQSTEVAGKDALFKVVVKEVKGLTLPKLDEEFVKLFGIDDGNVEQLKKEIKNNMQRELDLTLKAKAKSNVLESLNEANDTDLPRALIDQEIDGLRKQAMNQFSQGREGNVADLPEMPAALFEDQAKTRVKLALLVSEVIKVNEIIVDPDRVKETIESAAAAYDEPEQMVSWYYSNQQQLAQVESSVIEDQVVDFILDAAKVTEKKFSFDELMNKQT